MIKSFVELADARDPVLALAIHNGHAMHPALARNCGISEADRLREEDPFTENFAAAWPNRIVVHTSRFTADLNRAREKAVYQKPEDCWGMPVRIAPLTDSLLAELLDDYDQWHSLLAFTMNKLLARHPLLLVLDLHSYNHRRGGPKAEPDPQAQNPDIILGRNSLPEKHYPWVEKLQKRLNGTELNDLHLDCRVDVKFSGGHLSRRLHELFPGRVACLAVEFKKIFMDEWTGELDSSLQHSLSGLFHAAVRSLLPEFMVTGTEEAAS